MGAFAPPFELDQPAHAPDPLEPGPLILAPFRIDRSGRDGSERRRQGLDPSQPGQGARLRLGDLSFETGAEGP